MTDGDHRSLIDQALDAFVYAPIGLLLEARDLIPKMADRGRGQVALARLAGQVAQNQRRGPAAGAAHDSTSADESPAPVDRDQLPIPGYDDLSAPQIIPMLGSLSPIQLGEVLVHEETHRSRATVLNKIHQLQGRR